MADARAHLENTLNALANESGESGKSTAHEDVQSALEGLIHEIDGETRDKMVALPSECAQRKSRRKRSSPKKQIVEAIAETKPKTSRPKKVLSEDQLAVLKERLNKARETKAKKRAAVSEIAVAA
jgi:hypothetical protein